MLRGSGRPFAGRRLTPCQAHDKLTPHVASRRNVTEHLGSTTGSAVAKICANLLLGTDPIASCASTRFAGGEGGWYRLTTLAPMRDLLRSLNDGCNTFVWMRAAAYSLVRARNDSRPSKRP